MGWTLDNGEKRSAENPNTFKIPTLRDRNRLKPGQWAKLIFVSKHEEESLWVKVTETLTNGSYIGTLDSQIKEMADLKLGDPIVFKAEHVIDIHGQ